MQARFPFLSGQSVLLQDSVRSMLPSEDLEQPEEAKSTSGELTQLTKLHAEGALTDEEFAAAKKKVLGL